MYMYTLYICTCTNVFFVKQHLNAYNLHVLVISIIAYTLTSNKLSSHIISYNHKIATQSINMPTHTHPHTHTHTHTHTGTHTHSNEHIHTHTYTHTHTHTGTHTHSNEHIHTHTPLCTSFVSGTAMLEAPSS